MYAGAVIFHVIYVVLLAGIVIHRVLELRAERNHRLADDALVLQKIQSLQGERELKVYLAVYEEQNGLHGSFHAALGRLEAAGVIRPQRARCGHKYHTRWYLVQT